MDDATTPMLNLLRRNVFGIEVLGPGWFRVGEACDHYYSHDMTADELIALADEIRTLAEANRG